MKFENIKYYAVFCMPQFESEKLIQIHYYKSEAEQHRDFLQKKENDSDMPFGDTYIIREIYIPIPVKKNIVLKLKK